MKTAIPLAVLTAAMAAFAAAPQLSNARVAGQDAQSSSSSSSSESSSSNAMAAASSSSSDCPAKTATSQRPDPGRTTSSCSNPYVKQPGTSSSSSSSQLPR